MRGFYFEQPTLPSRIGYEAAGTVEAVGPGVDQRWLGKQVSTVPGFSQNKYGVLGEEAIVPAASVAEYPGKLSPIEGAAIWMQYLTAYGALVMRSAVGPGDFVLISAGSSSVGVAAIQIAKTEGATAIATTRTLEKKAALLSLGADHVIVTDVEDLAQRVEEITGGKGSRVIFDPVGGPFVEKLADAAAPGGIIFEYGALSMQPTPFPTMPMLAKSLSLRGYTLSEVKSEPETFRKAKQYVLDRLEDGRFVPKIAKVFSLSQTLEAYRFMQSNKQVGKIVITIA
jgi:NADPH:quinone reductase-like Zn-dependent oxidoreductase